MALPPEAAGHAVESSGLGGGSAAHKPGVRRDSVVITVRRRFGRRHAVGGNAIHGRVRDGRQRHRHPARLSRRNPRSCRHAGGRQRLSAQLLQSRGLHRRRRAQRAGRDESGGAQGQPRRPAAQRRADRRPRGLQRGESQARRLHLESAQRSFARQIPGLPGRRHQTDDARPARYRAQQSRGLPLPQSVRARDALVALSATDREHRALARIAASRRLRNCSTPT